VNRGDGPLVGGALVAAAVLWVVARDRKDTSTGTWAGDASRDVEMDAARAAVATAEVAHVRAEPQALSRTTVDLEGSPTAHTSRGRLATSLRFDPIFARLGRGIPIPYLRALAHAESGLNPDDPHGLINVVAVALRDYNRRHPASPISVAQMRDPLANVTVVVDILRTIIASYTRNHPSIANLREDWRNPRFVELLTAGWNAGYSERGGVGRVVQWLRARGVTDITVERVFAAGPAAGAAVTLANPAKLAFARKVTAAYLEARS